LTVTTKNPAATGRGSNRRFLRSSPLPRDCFAALATAHSEFSTVPVSGG